MEIKFTTQAANDLDKLPSKIADRFEKIYENLKNWPEVSGCFPLRHNLSGLYKKRFGDYRVIFKVEKKTLIIEKIAHRRDVYKE